MSEAYDALVVGAGMAGLTAAAYLAKAGYRVLVCERAETPGGLVADYTRGGFHFDAGLRAVENSGIIRPMLRDLGIDLPFLPNPVTIRIRDDIVRLDEVGLDGYAALLTHAFPGHKQDIEAIKSEVRKVGGVMDVLYGIDNPLFLDLKNDPKYLLHTMLPWLMRYQVSMRRIKRFQRPVEQHLARFTRSKALIDVVAQHFFRNTPASFALSYFRLYNDYAYPKGGTCALVRAMVDYLNNHGAEIRCGTAIAGIRPDARVATTADGTQVPYRKMVWAADMKSLYGAAEASPHAGFGTQAARVAQARGGDSVLTVFLSLDLDVETVSHAFGAHCFYTPAVEGLSALGLDSWAACIKRENKADAKAALEGWLCRFFALTTYEISCPAARDKSLAPAGQAGLIVSTLFHIDVVRYIDQQGWYDRFKQLCIQWITEQLGRALPGLHGHILDAQCATPLTMERMTGNADGAITGWSFCDDVPAESRFKHITKAIHTPIPHVVQAGQWTFSPSGLPVSVLTGKLAADAICKDMEQEKARQS